MKTVTVTLSFTDNFSGRTNNVRDDFHIDGADSRRRQCEVRNLTLSMSRNLVRDVVKDGYIVPDEECESGVYYPPNAFLGAIFDVTDEE